jgi:hypothetical protein
MLLKSRRGRPILPEMIAFPFGEAPANLVYQALTRIPGITPAQRHYGSGDWLA